MATDLVPILENNNCRNGNHLQSLRKTFLVVVGIYRHPLYSVKLFLQNGNGRFDQLAGRTGRTRKMTGNDVTHLYLIQPFR